MEIDIFIPIGTLIIGWILNESSKSIQFRKNNKEAISSAIADLLEIRHEINGTTLLFEEMQRRFLLSEQDMAHLKVLIGSVIPKQEALHQRYDESVTQLAKNNPLLAFELRSKNMVLPYLESLEALAGGDIEALVYLKQMDSKLRTIVVPELERVIKSLAWKFSLLTYFKISFHFGKSARIPEELERLLNEMEESINKNELNKSMQPTANASAD